MTAEGPTSDLLRRMLAAISAASAQEGVERLLENATAQAEAEVTDLVKSAMKASLLREVVRRLESEASGVPCREQLDARPASPRPREMSCRTGRRHEEGIGQRETKAILSATACYVYAICRDLPDGWSSPTPAIDPTSDIRTVRHRELQAVVSDVPSDAFSQAALDQRLGDRQWIEEKVRAHDAVVKSVAATTTAIPCRFCTVVRGQGDVESLLANHYEQISETLARLDGHSEWGVRISFDPGAVACGEAVTPEGGPSGRQYLRRRKKRDAQRAELQAKGTELAHECHTLLAEVADDATLLTPRPGKGQRVELANAAYLVNDERIEHFRHMADELSKRRELDGLQFIVTGPWPPYNFARLDLSMEAAT